MKRKQHYWMMRTQYKTSKNFTLNKNQCFEDRNKINVYLDENKQMILLDCFKKNDKWRLGGLSEDVQYYMILYIWRDKKYIYCYISVNIKKYKQLSCYPLECMNPCSSKLLEDDRILIRRLLTRYCLRSIKSEKDTM